MRALILAGGSGTRFWPASRRARPKQLLPLQGERSLLQLTVARIEPLIAADQVWVSTSSELHEAVARQVERVPEPQILSEPVARNTLPAIAWAVSRMPEPERVVAVLPSDHWVEDIAAFNRTLRRAFEAAEAGLVLTLGVAPRHAETGYGYLELASEADAAQMEPVRVARFVEKPDLATARRFVADGKHLWNAGIFVFKPTLLLALLERHRPELAAALERLPEAGPELREAFARLPAEPIDTGLMEHLEEIYTLPLDCGWSDLGSWAALDSVLGEEHGNRCHGDVVAVDASDNVVYAGDGTVAVLGVRGLVVVRSGDVVLVLPRERAQDVRQVVAEIEAAGRKDLL